MTTVTQVRPRPQETTPDLARMALEVMVSNFAAHGRRAELLTVVERYLGPLTIRRARR